LPSACPARGRRWPMVRRCGSARPVRQVDGAALCGSPRLHRRRRGAARRRRRSAHHAQRRVTPCCAQATPTATHRSVQANASPSCTEQQQARRVRRGGGAGAAAASEPPFCARRSLPPAPRCKPRTPTMHSRGAACQGRILRRTPTLPRHDMRVVLRISCRGHRTAVEGLVYIPHFRPQ
jgi:hypothetical protein